MRSPIPDRPFITRPKHLGRFGLRCARLGKTELAAAARRRIGAAVDLTFPRFIAWLRGEGYAFAGFDPGPLHLAERNAYLRFDVHGQDLLAAYVVADWHERLGIIGSFQITWRYSRHERALEPYFAKLLEFDRRFVEFGLHAAPTATWLLNSRFGGDTAAAERSVETDEFEQWLRELAAAHARDGDEAPVLRELRRATDDTLAEIAASFKATFGEARSVSGHGNFLTNAFVRVRGRHPEVDRLQPYFFPGDYLNKWGVARFGFHHYAATHGAGMLWEGDAAEVRRRNYRDRVASGQGFVALLHPASWTWRHNATFFLPEEEAIAAEPEPNSG